MDKAKIECRTPTPEKKSCRIDAWKFNTVRDAILAVVPATADGIRFRDLPDRVTSQLPEDARERLGSVGWYTTTVKLEMEVRGELTRLDGVVPQRLVRTSRA